MLFFKPFVDSEQILANKCWEPIKNKELIMKQFFQSAIVVITLGFAVVAPASAEEHRWTK